MGLIFHDMRVMSVISVLCVGVLWPRRSWRAQTLHWVWLFEGYEQVVHYLGLQIFIGVFLIVVGIASIWLVLYIRRTVLVPIQTFSENVTKLKSDESYSVATYYQINELGKASELLADMVGKIKGLKINIYEKTLEEQRIQTISCPYRLSPIFI